MNYRTDSERYSSSFSNHFTISHHESGGSGSSSSRSTSISQSHSNYFVSDSSTKNPNTVRSFALIDSIEFKVEGNISKHAITLADCDNDSQNELLVGTLGGKLLIFKDNATTPIVSKDELGMISCVVVGDILNTGKNCIVTLSIEGYLNIFSLLTAESYDSFQNSVDHGSAFFRRSSDQRLPAMAQNIRLPPTIDDNEELVEANFYLKLLHYQQVQANAMCAIIEDINNDKQNEFVVALSDRVVRLYRAVVYGPEDIKLVGIYKWELSDQIGSITLATFLDQINDNDVETEQSLSLQKCVLVSQHGGTFAKLNCREAFIAENVDQQCDDHLEHAIERFTPEQKNLTLPPIRNPQISSEIVSNLKISKPSDEKLNECEHHYDQKLVAIATTDGLVMLLEGQNIRWQYQLEQKVFSLCKHDIDGDGRDELVVCAWNGYTYIVNLDGQMVSCQVDQPVSSFCVGDYHVNGQRTTCLVYGTFTNKVQLFYSLEVSFHLDSSDNQMLDYIIEYEPSLLQQMQILSDKLNHKISNVEQQEQENDEYKVDEYKINCKLLQKLLYAIPQNTVAVQRSLSHS